MYHHFFIHSSADGRLGCFHVLAIVNSAGLNNGIHVSFSTLVSLGYMPRSEIAGSYSGLIPSILRDLHNVFHSDCIHLYSHQQCKSIPFSPHPLQHLLCVDILILAILSSVRWNLIVVLICISQIMSYVEHLFTFVSHLYVFFGEMSIWGFPHFLIGLFVFLVLSCMSCLYILEINPLLVDSFAIIFSHSECCLFILPIISISVQKLLSLIKSYLFNFVFISIILGGGS